MAKGPRKRKEPEKAPEGVHDLAQALDFISLAQKPDGQMITERHCLFAYGWALAFDGVLAAGHPIREETVAAPQSHRMRAALKYAGTGLSLAHSPNGDAIAITSGRYRVNVPCADPRIFPNIAPDPKVAHLTDAFREAITAVERVTRESGPSLHECSIQIVSGYCRGTNGKVMLQAEHGIDLPTLVVSKSFARALGKTDKRITGLGFSQSSCTIHFEDGAWLRTQLWDKPWPEAADAIVNTAGAQWYELPKDFMLAVDALRAHTPDDVLHVRNGMLRTHYDVETGATYQIDMPFEFSFMLKHIDHFLADVRYIADGRALGIGRRVLFGAQRWAERGFIVAMSPYAVS